MNNIYYLLNKSVDFQIIQKEIGKIFNFAINKTNKSRESVYDTFDWRLYKNNLLLSKDSFQYILYSLLNEEMIDDPQKTAKKELKFWWEFEKSSFKNILKSHLSCRALIQYLTLKNTTQYCRILNEDEKTLVFLQFTDIEIHKNEQKNNFKIINLKAVKGYGNELERLVSVINMFKTDQISLKDIYSNFYKSVSIKPESYTSKFNLKLNPKQNIMEASQKIFKYLINIMKQNEQGIINDVDTEFLHDFRVATRRTRSAMSQIKGIFPKYELEDFKNNFAFLAKLSNRLRDLDVYLLNKEKYKALIPPQLSEGLEAMFSNLQLERKRELNKFIHALQSESCQNIMKKWEIFLNRNLKSNDTDNLKNASVPVKEAAKRFIAQKYKYIRKIGKSINNESADKNLHALRIECKKLRYLLEFFSSLFPQDKINTLIKNLKKLQDNLGDFNDYYIQQTDLINYLENKVKLNNGAKVLSAAIGSLISVLHQEQKKVRSEFSKTFNEFNSKQNEKLFNEIFNE